MSAAFSPLPRPMPPDESKNSSTGSIPGSSIDVTHDWECVRSVRRLSSNTDINGDSEYSIEEWDCTLHETMRLDESGSLSLDEDEDALHVHTWDLIPEYRAALAVSETHTSPICTSVRSSHGGHRRNDGTGPCVQRLLLSLPHLFGYPYSPSSSPYFPDDTTLHPVAHFPADSALFPGPIRPSDEGTRNEQEVHGVLALLEPLRQHTGLRDGFVVACDESILPFNPFKLSTSPLIGLLGLVKGICAGIGPPCAK